jgi:hypothetical protein
VKTGSNASTIAQRVVTGDKKGTQCLGAYPGHPVLGEYKYWELALQVGAVSKQRPENVVMSPMGLGPENDSAGEDQQQL